MLSPRRSFVITLLVTFALFIVGCGGSGGGSSTPNPFAGAWTGDNGNGTVFTIVIASNGQMSGTDGSGGSVTGSITSGGTENVSYTSANATVTFTLLGLATIDSRGHLIGSGTVKINGTTQTYTQDWTKQ